MGIRLEGQVEGWSSGKL